MYEVFSIPAQWCPPERESGCRSIACINIEAFKPFVSYAWYSLLEEAAGLVHETSLTGSTLSSWGIATLALVLVMLLLCKVLRKGTGNSPSYGTKECMAARFMPGKASCGPSSQSAK